MNERLKELALQSGFETLPSKLKVSFGDNESTTSTWEYPHEKFAELIVRECASEYNKLINGESVVLPKDREHAEALVRVGMFYLENNK
jgi:hypothetical protein